jgi:hypothetical protein
MVIPGDVDSDAGSGEFEVAAALALEEGLFIVGISSE